MSNLGFQSIYQMLNALPDVLCERAFLPDDRDREDLERSGQSLVSLESGTDLRRFPALAFSVSFENDYLHVLQMLRLSGTALPAAERGKSNPLAFPGGCVPVVTPER